MTVQRGERKAARRQLLLGLLLVVAFIGHDLVMASASASAGVAVSGHAAILPLHATERNRSGHKTPEPHHPEHCSISQPAIPRGGDGSSLLDRVPATTPDLIISMEPVAACRVPWWEEPRRPPQTRRALLQIYRI